MYQKLISPLGEDNKSVKRLTDGAVIPMENGNRDYQTYLKWLEEGNTPEPADVPEGE